MTPKQKEHIQYLRSNGIGYSKISKTLGISKNTVKSYCRRSRLGGVAVTKKKAKIEAGNFCLNCGSQLIQVKGKKLRKFCSDTCRTAWWNSHPECVNKKANYSITCAGCGKSFISYGNKNRLYCCHACYISNRFGKNRGI